MRHARSESKTQNFSLTLKRMIRDFKPQYPILIVIIILAISASIITIISPLFLRDFLENINKLLIISPIGEISLDWNFFWTNFCILSSLYLASAILMFSSEWISVKLGSKYAFDMREKIQAKINTLPLSYFDKVPYGETLSTGTNDVDNISRNLQNIIVQTTSGITLFLGTMLAMFFAEWKLAFVAIASLPFIIIIVFLITKFSQKQFIGYRKELGILNGKIEENYAGYKIIKLFNKEESTIEDFLTTNTKMARSDRLSQFFSGLIFPTTNFINNLAFVGVAVVGGLINDVSSMIIFFIFLRLFTSPFQQIGQIMNIIQSVVASGERIYTLLDQEEETKDLENAIDNEDLIKGQYSFENVNFSYIKEKPLIQNLNLIVNVGESIAIVGPTGAGKTTLVNLLMRFYDIDSGVINLDNKNLNSYKRDTLRGTVGMVLQDTWLFKGTIRENVLYGAPESREEELIKACKEAHAYHFIKTLPGGFDFKLNEDGNNISQGQKQLLTIARAILSKPKIIILDEATSSVDTRTEKQIQDAMNRIMIGHTSFVIAHRLSTIKNAKLILVMKKGNIIESGTHQELIAKKGFYTELYNAQFLGVVEDNLDVSNKSEVLLNQ